MASDPSQWLRMGVEQYLRDLSDSEFSRLVETTRPTYSAEVSR